MTSRLEPIINCHHFTIFLSCADQTLTCDGVIAVDGSDAGSSFPGAGGGSGGSVQIHTSHHRGRGQIHAHGGDCSCEFYHPDILLLFFF